MKAYSKFVNHKNYTGFRRQGNDQRVIEQDEESKRTGQQAEESFRQSNEACSQPVQPTGKPRKDTIQRATSVFASFMQRQAQEARAAAMPANHADKDEEVLDRVAARLLEQVEKQQDTEQLGAIETESPSCLDDLFWDMKIESNSNCLHKW